jgi:hypothetical protein
VIVRFGGALTWQADVSNMPSQTNEVGMLLTNDGLPGTRQRSNNAPGGAVLMDVRGLTTHKGSDNPLTPPG